MRTWIETGRGNYCMRCFVVAAGGLAPDEMRLGGVDCLPRSFALPQWGRGPMARPPLRGKHGGTGGAAPPEGRGAPFRARPGSGARASDDY
jgi:hypothetical protein